jgi:short-subunit dehydrogenase
MTTALITGASAGIGAAFAQQLAARQTDLVLVARSQDKLQELAHFLKHQHRIQVDIIVQDLTAPDAAETIVRCSNLDDRSTYWSIMLELEITVILPKVIETFSLKWCSLILRR